MAKKQAPPVEMEKENLEKLKEEHASETNSDITKNEETSPQTETTPQIDGPRKRGRPKGSKNKAGNVTGTPVPVSQLIPEEMMIAAIKAPYYLAAMKYGPHWALTDDEAKMMVPSHTALAVKYLPTYVTDNSELITVCLLHGMSLISRVKIEMELKAEKDKLGPSLVMSQGEQIESDNVVRETRFGKVIQTESPTGMPPESHPISFVNGAYVFRIYAGYRF